MSKITVEELADSLIEYLNGLGITNEQAQALIDSNLLDVKGAINSLETSVNNLKTYEETTRESVDNLWNDHRALITEHGTTRTSLVNAWDTINTVNERDLAGQVHKLTDNNGYCRHFGSEDINTFKKCGFYMGSGMTNGPIADTRWWMIFVMGHNDIWTFQFATDFADGTNRYVRYQKNGGWTAWVQV